MSNDNKEEPMVKASKGMSKAREELLASVASNLNEELDKDQVKIPEAVFVQTYLTPIATGTFQGSQAEFDYLKLVGLHGQLDVTDDSGKVLFRTPPLYKEIDTTDVDVDLDVVSRGYLERQGGLEVVASSYLANGINDAVSTMKTDDKVDEWKEIIEKYKDPETTKTEETANIAKPKNLNHDEHEDEVEL